MEYAPRPPIITGIKGRCPRCGEGHLFRPGTFLKVAAKCEVCGLSYAFADPADGSAFFSMMVMAFPATGFAHFRLMPVQYRVTPDRQGGAELLRIDAKQPTSPIRLTPVQWGILEAARFIERQ